MHPRLLPRLACPRCHGTLRLAERGAQDEIAEGEIRCTACGHAYAIRTGIPRLLTNEAQVRGTQVSFGAQWRARMEGRFESETLFGLTREEELQLFFRSLDLRPEDVRGKWVLDAGCGSGRLTCGLAASGGDVVGFDVSPTISYLAHQRQTLPNLHLVQGSILDVPITHSSFDVVWSMGVIHHTGDTVRAFRNLAQVVKPGGRLYVWVYSSRRLTLYKLIRDALRFSYKVPKDLLFYLCYAMAPALKVYHLAKFAVRRIRGKPITPRERREAQIRTIAFELHDDLAPPYQTRHTPEEVAGWFRESGFSDIVVVDEVGVRGVRAGS